MLSILLTAESVYDTLGSHMLIVWIVLAVLFGLGELITQGLTSIWFTIGAVVAAILAFVGAPIWAQCLAFVFVSVVTLILTRPLATKFNDKTVKTNSENLIGKTCYVVETIDNAAGKGKVKIGDLEWTARAKDDSMVIEEGKQIIIMQIVGVTCYVEPFGSQSGEN